MSQVVISVPVEIKLSGLSFLFKAKSLDTDEFTVRFLKSS
jgi:hypothetical protein